ncbi:MAG TPA: hypothetical protein VK508_04710 [Cyclobacteriaceae bacterium]|nr:hypothetical protein [Cyclobacteriaceae bacterium]
MKEEVQSPDKNFVFIEFEYNGREIVGIDEFRKKLEDSYHFVQCRSRFIAAASEGGEVWLTVFINSPIVEFLVGNMLWDVFKYGVKKMFLRPLIAALSALEKANASAAGLRVKKLKFQFDDTYVYVGGINGNFISVIGAIFQKLAGLMSKFKAEVSLPVTSIELPLHYNDSVDAHGHNKYSIDTFHDRVDTEFYISQWKVNYMNGHDCRVYDFKKDEFLGC